MRVSAIQPVAPVSCIPRITAGKAPKKAELFTLYYKDRSKPSFQFEAKSVEAAIRYAKRKLGLPPTASSEKFRQAGGDYVLQNSTGNRVYPETKH